MICNSCGRDAVNKEANFCDYCGASLKQNSIEREEGGVSFVTSQIKEESPHSAEQQRGGSNILKEGESEEKPVSFLNWVGTMILPFIPIVGWIIYLVMLFVWSFGSDTNRTKKNWARAMLVVIVIGIALVIIFFTSMVMNILNSGMNLEGYMNEYYRNQGIFQ